MEILEMWTDFDMRYPKLYSLNFVTNINNITEILISSTSLLKHVLQRGSYQHSVSTIQKLWRGYFFLTLASFFVQINLPENCLNRISLQIVNLREEGFPQFEDHCLVDLLSFNNFLLCSQNVSYRLMFLFSSHQWHSLYSCRKQLTILICWKSCRRFGVRRNTPSQVLISSMKVKVHIYIVLQYKLWWADGGVPQRCCCNY